jgi:hypothetical protein
MVGPKDMARPSGFADNKKRKGAFRTAAIAVLLFSLGPLRAAALKPPALTLDELLAGLQKSFAARDLEAYASAFAPEIRDRERRNAAAFMNQSAMTSLILKRTERNAEKEGPPGVFLQVVFENDIRAILANWRIELVRDGEGWLIARKDVPGPFTTLYKIRIPGGPAERAKRVTVRHEDIEVVFEDAWVFHDNIPDLETAFLVVGPGTLRFTPSSATERHQLELRYRRESIVDALENAFFRVSDDFARSNIVIETDPAGGEPSPQDLARAYSLFSKYYPMSFTVENSLNDEILSFPPRGDQAVFELKTRRTGELSYVFSPFSDDEISLVRRDSEPPQVLNLYSPERPAAGGGREMFISFGEKYDVERYEIEADFDPARLYLSARARIAVRAQLDAVDSLKFNFNPDLNILRVFDKEGRELFFTQDKFRKLLYIYLLDPLERDASTTVDVYYRGVIEIPEISTDVVTGGQIVDQIILPRFETYLYSQSSLWYPAPAEQDYFQARIVFSVPPGYFLLTNGAFIGEGTVESIRRIAALDKVGNKVFHYETKNPVKYLTFITGLFERLDGSGAPGRPEISGYIASDVRAPRRTLIEEARAVLECYERWFGPYPYEKLDLVQRSWPTAGGHSPASFIILNELPRTPEGRLVPNPDSPVELFRYRAYGLAHEIAHQWWGQAVTWDRYRDQWLSEGLAQYASARYIREQEGERAYTAILKRFAQWTERASNYGPITLGSRISYLDFNAYQAIVYDKSAVALQMLSDLLGEDVFFRGLRAFQEAFRFRAARTANFQKSLETVSGRDLGPFFQAWFDSHLLPDAYVTPEVFKRGDEFILRVRIVQSGTLFPFPLWISWRENRETVRRMVEVSAADQTFEFARPSRPTKIKVDPDKLVPGSLR